MKKASAAIGIIIVLASLVLIAPFISAQQEYQYGWIVYKKCPEMNTGIFDLDCWLGKTTDPYSPKVACKSDNSHCMALIYDDTYHATYKIFSVDSFVTYPAQNRGGIGFDYGTAWLSPLTGHPPENILTQHTNYSLPYDIWAEPQGNYYIMIGGTSQGGGNIVYLHNTATGHDIQVWNLTNTAFNSYAMVGIFNKNTEHPKIWVLNDTCGGQYSGGVMYWLENGTVANGIGNVINWGGGASPCTSGMAMLVKGFIGSDTVYDIYAIRSLSYGTTYAAYSNLTATNLPSFPTDLNGISYWDGFNFIYSRAANITSNMSAGLYRTTTIDLTSWTAPDAYHIFNSGISESIPATSDEQKQKEIWTYSLRTNLTGSSNGIYAYGISLFPILLQLNSIDQYGNTVSESGYATINCPNYSTTVSGTGSIITQSQCQTNNTIIISTSGTIPSIFTTNFDILCPNQYTYLQTKYAKPMNVTITVIDSLRGWRVSGAVVSIFGLASNTTDANGTATFYNINPFSNPTLQKKASSGCNYPLLISGGTQPYSYSITKSGYATVTVNSITFGSINNNIPTYDATKIVYMTPNIGVVNVRLLTSDLKEINPLCAKLTIDSDATNTTWEYLGQLIKTNQATRFPAKFYLETNISTISLTLTLNLSNQTYTYSTAIAFNETKNIDWSLPFTSQAIPCCQSNDCPANYCNGQFNNQLSSCTNGVCQYNVTDCISQDLCDSKAGCFDYDTGQNCTRDTECTPSCFDGYTMLYMKCGLIGCVGKQSQCTTFCNSTLGVCDEVKNCLMPTITNGGEYLFSIGFVRGAELVTGAGSISTDFKCTFDRVGKSICAIQNIVFPSSDLSLNGVSISNLVTSPSNWGYVLNTTDNAYHFYDLSVGCNSTCQVSYQVCQYGCNPITGLCKSSSTTFQAKQWIDTISEMINGLAPDPASKASIWTILVIAFLTLITVLTKKWEAGAISGLAVALLGVILTWYPIWVGIVFIVLTGLMLAGIVSKRINLS